jgi:hypothetical protein
MPRSKVTFEIEPDDSKDIGVFIHGLEDCRMVDILETWRIMLQNINELEPAP